jgi:hypothetical protein
MLTLLHAIEIGDNIVHFLLLIRGIHSVVELYIFGLELRMENSKRLGKLPLRSCCYHSSADDWRGTRVGTLTSGYQR